MPRLPQPGSDKGTWGEILNDFLDVEFNSNGTLRKAIDITQANQTAGYALTTAQSAQSTADDKLALEDIDTDITLSTNSDVKIASQRATKSYVDNVVLNGSPVISVNNKTGAVVLSTADVIDNANRRYTNDASISRLANTSGTNSGDQDLSGLVPNSRKVNGQPLISDIILTKSHIGLDNVNDTSDADKPLSNMAVSALAEKANITDLATVATTGNYNDLAYRPSLGTAAASDISDFATAAQGVDSRIPTNDSDIVHITGTETLSGDKIFTGTTTVPTPTLSAHAATKAYVDNSSDLLIPQSARGTSGGVAPLDETGKVPATNLPDTSSGDGSIWFDSANLASISPWVQTTMNSSIEATSVRAVTAGRYIGLRMVIPSSWRSFDIELWWMHQDPNPAAMFRFTPYGVVVAPGDDYPRVALAPPNKGGAEYTLSGNSAYVTIGSPLVVRRSTLASLECFDPMKRLFIGATHGTNAESVSPMTTPVGWLGFNFVRTL